MSNNTEHEDLASYDVILVNTSAGKDSQAMLDLVYNLAKARGVEDRLVAVHADLGRVEWEGTAALAREQAEHYGVRFEIVSRPQGDLLDHIEARGMFPSSAARYCTSDHKRGQVAKVFTKLAKELRDSGKVTGRPVRILNAMGLRAEESKARAKRLAASPSGFEPNKRASNGRRTVVDWYPIATWTEAEVWQRIREAGTRHHRAYDLGMPRLSCCFCIFAPRDALVIAGRANRELLAQYVEVEEKIGHTFKADLSLREIADAVDAGENPEAVKTWSECA